jgi:hypothetical protein
MAEDPRDVAAREFDAAAQELDLAARHLRTTARHFRDRDVPRACAHAYAAYGHMIAAQRTVDERAGIHAAKSIPD